MEDIEKDWIGKDYSGGTEPPQYLFPSVGLFLSSGVLNIRVTMHPGRLYYRGQHDSTVGPPTAAPSQLVMIYTLH